MFKNVGTGSGHCLQISNPDILLINQDCTQGRPVFSALDHEN